MLFWGPICGPIRLSAILGMFGADSGVSLDAAWGLVCGLFMADLESASGCLAEAAAKGSCRG